MKINKKLLLLLVVFASILFAQDYNVSLKVIVTRSDNGRRIPGAQVRLFGLLNGTFSTNEQGILIVTGQAQTNWEQQSISDVYAYGYLKPIIQETGMGTGVLGFNFHRNNRNVTINITLDPIYMANNVNLKKVRLIKPKNNQVAPASFTFKWETIPTVRVYEIQISIDFNFGSILYKDYVENVATFREQEKRFSGFYEGRTYYWRVRAGNGINWGEWSNIESFRYSSTYRPRDW